MELNWHQVDRFLMGEAWAGSLITQHVTELCDVIGSRWGGSKDIPIVKWVLPANADPEKISADPAISNNFAHHLMIDFIRFSKDVYRKISFKEVLKNKNEYIRKKAKK